MSGSTSLGAVHQAVQDHVAGLVREEAERLEALCAEALSLTPLNWWPTLTVVRRSGVPDTVACLRGVTLDNTPAFYTTVLDLGFVR